MSRRCHRYPRATLVPAATILWFTSLVSALAGASIPPDLSPCAASFSFATEFRTQDNVTRDVAILTSGTITIATDALDDWIPSDATTSRFSFLLKNRQKAGVYLGAGLVIPAEVPGSDARWTGYLAAHQKRVTAATGATITVRDFAAAPAEPFAPAFGWPTRAALFRYATAPGTVPVAELHVIAVDGSRAVLFVVFGPEPGVTAVVEQLRFFLLRMEIYG